MGRWQRFALVVPVNSMSACLRVKRTCSRIYTTQNWVGTRDVIASLYKCEYPHTLSALFYCHRYVTLKERQWRHWQLLSRWTGDTEAIIVFIECFKEGDVLCTHVAPFTKTIPSILNNQFHQWYNKYSCMELSKFQNFEIKKNPHITEIFRKYFLKIL